MREVGEQAIYVLNHIQILKEEALQDGKYWIRLWRWSWLFFSSSVENKVKEAMIWFEAADAIQGPVEIQPSNADTSQNETKVHISFCIILTSSS